MDDRLRRIEPEDIGDNFFKLIGSDWFLLTAGPPEDYNTMTAASGAMGVHIGIRLAICMVRPQRYTYEFTEREETFTLSFFDESYRGALELCGTKSGRDIDKAAETGLTPIPCELPRTTAFAEARLIIECRKVAFMDLDPDKFVGPAFEKLYPQKDYHRLYFGEIVNCWAR